MGELVLLRLREQVVQFLIDLFCSANHPIQSRIHFGMIQKAVALGRIGQALEISGLLLKQLHEYGSPLRSALVQRKVPQFSRFRERYQNKIWPNCSSLSIASEILEINQAKSYAGPPKI
jgi:hypothetical protein